MIGAAAMAVHGISRSTRDLDLFTLDRSCLNARAWEALRATGVDAQARTGDADDPLAGVVRFTASGEAPLDLIVGKSPWQVGIVGRSRDAEIEGVRVPVASRADLILLKLYAGGPQDAWDVEQLLDCPERAALTGEIDRAVAALPADSHALWTRIKGTAAR